MMGKTLYDTDIREPLFDFLEEMYGKVRVIEEKMMGKSRADIIAVTDGTIIGIEIKSDADTYARLSRQVKDYDLFFDKNYVVVGKSHSMHVMEHVPEHWGILVAEKVQSGIVFTVMRMPEDNPNLDIQKKLGILWRPELAHIQEINEMPKYKDKSKVWVIEKIVQRIPHDLLRYQVTEELFERDYTTIADRINKYRIQNGQKKRRKRTRKKNTMK